MPKLVNVEQLVFLVTVGGNSPAIQRNVSIFMMLVRSRYFYNIVTDKDMTHDQGMFRFCQTSYSNNVKTTIQGDLHLLSVLVYKISSDLEL